MDSLFVPLLAKKLYQSDSGQQLAKFSREEAQAQIKLLQAALGEVDETPKFLKPVSMVFYENGKILYEKDKLFKLAKLRHALLKLVYESEEWSVAPYIAMKEVWETGVVDENTIKNMMRNINHDLDREGIPLQLYFSNFFICLKIYPKST